MKIAFVSFIFTVITNLIFSQPTVTDIDSNVYKTVKIGNQIWMAENLKVTKYRKGEPIPLITDSVAWTNLTAGAYCNYRNDENIANIYGRMYNWYVVVDKRNVCPAGWHVPSDKEWAKLEKFLGGYLVAGGKMKLKDSTIWREPNLGATNESGFSGLPGGRQYHSGFFFLHEYGMYWAITEMDKTLAWSRYLTYSSPQLSRFTYKKYYGLTIRCVKD